MNKKEDNDTKKSKETNKIKGNKEEKGKINDN